MKPQRKSLKNSNRRAAALSFFLFGAIALTTVVTLEYLDYRSGKYSFIFSQDHPPAAKNCPQPKNSTAK